MLGPWKPTLVSRATVRAREQQLDGVGAPILRQRHLAQIEQTRLIEARSTQGASQRRRLLHLLFDPVQLGQLVEREEGCQSRVQLRAPMPHPRRAVGSRLRDRKRIRLRLEVQAAMSQHAGVRHLDAAEAMAAAELDAGAKALVRR